MAECPAASAWTLPAADLRVTATDLAVAVAAAAEALVVAVVAVAVVDVVAAAVVVSVDAVVAAEASALLLVAASLARRSLLIKGSNLSNAFGTFSGVGLSGLSFQNKLAALFGLVGFEKMLHPEA